MILPVKTMIYTTINLEDYGRTVQVVKQNNLPCSCGENDKHELITVANWACGLKKDTLEYIMPNNHRGEVTETMDSENPETYVGIPLKICGKSIENSIKKHFVRVCDENERKQRWELINNSINPPKEGFGDVGGGLCVVF